MMKRILSLILVLTAAAGMARGQTSASYKLTESTMSSGGDPHNGAFAASAAYRIELDALGQAVVAVGLAGAGFHLDAGFVDAYPPPKEVLNVRWTTSTSLAWDPEPSVGNYDLYRNLLSTLPGTFGSCFQSGIAGESWTDATTPSTGTGWFYIVTPEPACRGGDEGIPVQRRRASQPFSLSLAGPSNILKEIPRKVIELRTCAQHGPPG